VKSVRHKKRPQPEAFNRGVDPLSIWLHNDVELRIQSGDTISFVAEMIMQHWPKISIVKARRIAAYWFALGERVARGYTGPWNRKELDRSPTRVYRPKYPRR